MRLSVLPPLIHMLHQGMQVCLSLAGAGVPTYFPLFCRQSALAAVWGDEEGSRKHRSWIFSCPVCGLMKMYLPEQDCSRRLLQWGLPGWTAVGGVGHKVISSPSAC